MNTFTDFDPYAESAVVLDHLSDEQRLRYFGTADDAEAARQLVAERAAAGPVAPGVNPAPTHLAEHTEGLRVRAEATRSFDWLLNGVRVGALGFCAVFLVGGIAAMIWAGVTQDGDRTSMGLTVLSVIVGVSMVLGFLGLIANSLLTRFAENRRRAAQLEWASHRPGQFGRGLPGLSGNTFVVPGGAARTGRLAAGLVTLGLFTGGAGAVLGYLAVQEGDLTLVGTGLLLVVLGLGAAWVGWRIPGWERRRDARDAAEFRALAWRAPRDAR
ncbi:hypothetical protein IPV09_09340 [Tessaracoccus sp. SD287]|uniref:hypothetical protein n=1 Tax=Tessaracoccus sp. SD287 TaxID=2782008 RepID=UPI001A972761|nr:hypothetical protein [Tessaracoccus sp. SD287]MBO1031538.1 hypothetical protein [Tessaracoccus sp. SD287]